MTVNLMKKTCPCGSEYETRAYNSVYCPECRRARHNARISVYQKTEAGKATRKKANAKFYAKKLAAPPEELEAYQAKRREYRRRYYEKHREECIARARARIQGEVAIPRLALEGGLVQRPCDNGCGTLITAKGLKGRVFCEKCREETRRAHKERYRKSEKGQAQQKAANLRFSLNEEAKARKAERTRIRRQEHRLAFMGPPKKPGRKPKVELEPKVAVVKPVKEKPAPVPKPPKAKPVKVQAQVERRLPTEEEKLLMLRAALKRYHGN